MAKILVSSLVNHGLSWWNFTNWESNIKSSLQFPIIAKKQERYYGIRRLLDSSWQFQTLWKYEKKIIQWEFYMLIWNAKLHSKKCRMIVASASIFTRRWRLSQWQGYISFRKCEFLPYLFYHIIKFLLHFMHKFLLFPPQFLP